MKFNVELDFDEWDKTVNVLSTAPYKDVYKIIAAIQKQVNEQIEKEKEIQCKRLAIHKLTLDTTSLLY